jgi:hypothetical protein
VIISYPGAQQMAGGTVTSVGGNTIHTFNSSGYLTPLTYVGNSLRFRSSASAYLNRTFGTPTNNKIWTYSAWVKLGALGTDTILLASVNGLNTGDTLYFTGNNLRFVNGNITFNLITSAVYRDPAAWYHVVLAVDSTQATSTNRIKIYVNGTQITAFGTAVYPSQNYSFEMNSAVSHTIAVERTTRYSDYYISNTQFIDGQALTPNSFGSFNQYGVWQPVNYGGSYGTNGFYLPFSNTTSTTTLGYDFSPNGNNWTTNNISLTAGRTYDSMTDVPTLTSATAANYPVLNPLTYIGIGVIALNYANLTVAGNNGGYIAALSTMGITSGKFYFEAILTTSSGSADQWGLGLYDATKIGATTVPWYYSTTYVLLGNGNKYNNNASGGASGVGTWGLNDVMGVAYDATAGTLQVNKNGGAFTTIYSGIPAGTYLFGVNTYSASDVMNANFGQQPWTYTPPSGFLALNTYNM